MGQDLGKKLFRVSWIVYFISYIGRLNYTASMIEIGQSEGYTATMLGGIVTALFMSYSIGQLISGIVGDYYSARKSVCVGLIGCALCNLGMLMAQSYWQLLVVWGLNGLAVSLIWPPIVKLFAQYMSPEYLHKSCFNIQTSVALGTFFTYLMCGMILQVFPWQMVFLITAILLIGAVCLWQIVMKQLEEQYRNQITTKKKVLDEVDHQLVNINTINPAYPVEQSFIKVVGSSGLLMILGAILIMGFLKDGIMTWVPQYITKTFDTPAYFSIFLTALLPLVNLSGIYMIKYMNNKNAKDDLKTTAIFYGISVISLLLLVIIGQRNIYISLFLFSVVTSCMLGINTVLVSILPTYFASYNKTAFVAGLTNCVTYLGSGICGYGLGVLVEGYGWQVTSLVLVGICVVGSISCLAARPMWQKFKENHITF